MRSQPLLLRKWRKWHKGCRSRICALFLATECGILTVVKRNARAGHERQRGNIACRKTRQSPPPARARAISRLMQQRLAEKKAAWVAMLHGRISIRRPIETPPGNAARKSAASCTTASGWPRLAAAPPAAPSTRWLSTVRRSTPKAGIWNLPSSAT